MLAILGNRIIIPDNKTCQRHLAVTNPAHHIPDVRGFVVPEQKSQCKKDSQKNGPGNCIIITSVFVIRHGAYPLYTYEKIGLDRNIANQTGMLTEKSNKFLKRILDRLIKISMMPEIIFHFKRCRHSTVVVQRFCKPKVAGSNPAAGTISPSH